ncbi:MAG: sugar phosphate isomerase/epimerase, partial [Nanoarchaeota archaeon]
EIKDKRGPFLIINPETGAPQTINRDLSYFPEQGEFKEKGREFNADRELLKVNKESWLQNLAQINRYVGIGNQELSQLFGKDNPNKINMEDPAIRKELKEILNPNFDINTLDGVAKQRAKEIQGVINHGQIYLRDAYRGMQDLFDKAYKSSSGEDKEKLKRFANEIAPQINGLENNPLEINRLSEILETGVRVLGQIETPKTFVPMNTFIIEKSAQTFANVAKNAFDKYGEKSPIINIENPPAGGGISKAEDLKLLIEKSREKFVENLMKDGVSKSQAQDTAKKMIGATWDVGHINMLRKQGYSEKDVIKQTEIIAPFVKHVHLSDNFGFEHTELPMGMGNVPIKEIMQKLGEKGFEGKKIIEAGNWWQHFTAQGTKNNPFQPTIEAFGSNAYTSGGALNWGNSGGAFGGYAMGVGNINPRVHQTIYGATGFSGLPQELGGNIGGEQSRFSGTPNQ